RSENDLKAVEKMVSSALGLDTERGDNINVTSMPFVTTTDDQMLTDGVPANLLYEYLPLIKIGLLAFGALLFYFLLVRPLIKTIKTEVTEHNSTVTELEQAVQDMNDAKEQENRKAEVANLAEDSELDAVITLRNEIMQNHVPTAYIIKNWINEG
ncbi:flagellar M-ring protein FliF, partial [Desulfotalea psychrophila]|nr:flagellar M-ring protein FliF [Desulfotalea psychrophila]